MNELVSIVVPVYNVESYLNRCLESITAQTCGNLEIILVDDGSTDGSSALCDQWAARDSRIRVIHKENEGLGMARNTGMDHARGRYIFFFDSDDYVDVTLVEKCVRCGREQKAEVVLYGCHHVRGDAVTASPVTVNRTLYRGEEVRSELLPGLFTYELGIGVSAWGKMDDLELLRRSGLRFPSEREVICEDGWFMLELFSHVSAAAVLPECLYYYCHRPGSLSRRCQQDRQARNDAFLCRCEAYIRAAGLPEKTVFHVQSRYHGLTLGAMMQLLRSNLPGREKRDALDEIYRSPVLRGTLTEEVLPLDAPLPRLFWRCLRRRRYGMCTLLLYANHLRQTMGACP